MNKLMVLEECVYNTPLALLELKDKDSIDYVNNLLPYSVGIEIECHRGPDYNIKFFEDIPNIMDVVVDGGEQRYRIPKGIDGMVCLYRLCILLKEYSLMTDSGHHYHIDLEEINGINNTFLEKHSSWILKELEKWKYSGTYNKKRIGGWIRRSHFPTLEFRIGNMTFEYDVIIKRLIHASDIVRRLKLDYIKSYEEHWKKHAEEKIKALRNKLKEEQEKNTDLEEIKNKIGTRVIKI